MHYRRILIPGDTYFFTVNLADRRQHLLTTQIKNLRQVVHDVRRGHPFDVIAWVVLPEHMHAI